MNVPCGDSREAQLVFFTLKNGKWEYRNEPISHIPFLSTPQSVQKKPIPDNTASTEAFNNYSYNKLLDSIMDALSPMGIWDGWLVIAPFSFPPPLLSTLSCLVLTFHPYFFNLVSRYKYNLIDFFIFFLGIKLEKKKKKGFEILKGVFFLGNYTLSNKKRMHLIYTISLRVLLL